MTFRAERFHWGDDSELEWHPSPQEKDWDESKHPRGKTSDESTPGSFAPAEGGGGEGSEAKQPSAAAPKLNPEVVNVGGDEWNKRTAVRLEESYQRVRPELEKLALASVGATKPPPSGKDYDWSEFSDLEQDQAYTLWKQEQLLENPKLTGEETAGMWDAMSDSHKAEIAVEFGIEPPHPDDDEDEDQPYVPDEWDTMSNADQEAAAEQWKNDNEDEWKQNEANYYYEEYAPHEAGEKVAEDFNNGNETEWAKDALADAGDPEPSSYTGLKLPEELPFTDDQILHALTINFEANTGGSLYDPEFEWDDDYLDSLKAPPPEQMRLPGIEAEHASQLLTEDMRKTIEKVLTRAFDSKRADVASELDVPDWVYENINDSMNESWDSMSDKDKFAYVQNSTNILEEYEKALEKKLEAVPAGLPTKYDPLNETTGADYKLTQRLAQYMSTARAMELFEQRKIRPEISGLKVGSDAWKVALRHHLAKADRVLWGAWKSSSTTDDGILLQHATADELGGRLYTGHMQMRRMTDAEVKHRADAAWHDIGGYDGVKAYLRAKWETTQYLLDKAGINTLNLYRGYALKDRAKFDKLYDASRRVFLYELRHFAAREKVGGYQFLPTLDVQRNGAVSTTTDDTVANGWKKGHETGVVLRADVPRTAALSVPAYGINEHSEHEVVIAGTAIRGWDVWAGKAPRFEDVPLMKHTAAA